MTRAGKITAAAMWTFIGLVTISCVATSLIEGTWEMLLVPVATLFIFGLANHRWPKDSDR